MKSQKLLSYTRRAINDYDMISPGDKIAIGKSITFNRIGTRRTDTLEN